MVTTLDNDRRLLPFGQVPGVRLSGLVAVQFAGLDLNAAWSREPVTLGAGGGRPAISHRAMIPGPGPVLDARSRYPWLGGSSW